LTFCFYPIPPHGGAKAKQNINKIGKSKTKFHHFHFLFAPERAQNDVLPGTDWAKAKLAKTSVADTKISSEEIRKVFIVYATRPFSNK
jgi:diadenosine tetraphosphate (Ap4A) HIT family hydrolase